MTVRQGMLVQDLTAQVLNRVQHGHDLHDSLECRIGLEWSSHPREIEVLKVQKNPDGSRSWCREKKHLAPAAVVTLIRPQGSILEASRRLPEALEYETDSGGCSDDADGEFYPLAVLTGGAWKHLGLQGATRWKHVREQEFLQLFGMSKASFDRLPSWKQLRFKKKHGLF
ncbi:unnamed protein product [Polarella glacialis]|uniref:HP domain-containing protein n=1 Tax=Polarella glacialis TaxID=89957 RepID=A0A813ISL1_POLGL|nr:unnamed protein product [Polarella glacialis]CAE8648897.1 unnamed protein product [Polarella glacialis]CAE8656017.1 unnamed protein product [Polarella glacialis]